MTTTNKEAEVALTKDFNAGKNKDFDCAIINYTKAIELDPEDAKAYFNRGHAYNKLNKYDKNDPKFQNNIDNQFSPNIGAGIYYHSDKLYAGVSVPFILETKHFDDNTNSVAKDALHYYFIGGYVLDVSESTKFKPAFLIKSVKGAPLQADLTANFMFHDKFVVGGAWRWSAAVSGLVGFQVDSNWFVGYTYDSDTTKLANYNSGSHEIFLRYEFKGKQEKIISPRFF